MKVNERDICYSKGHIIFHEEGVSEDFMGGPHFFPNLKRGGHVFFQSLILNIFFKKGMQYQKSECKLYY